VGGGGDGSPVCVPVFGGASRIPRSSDKIGEGGTSSAPIPKMCGSGGRPKQPVKLGPAVVRVKPRRPTPKPVRNQQP
jgi:hypothetical protein